VTITAVKTGHIVRPASYTATANMSGLAFVALTSDFIPPSDAASQPWPGDHGPWNLRLLSATSSDGLTFARSSHVVINQGDVPDLTMDDNGWLYLYYTGWTVGSEMNKTVVAISADQGSTWIYKKLVFSGFTGMADPVDPDIQILSDGTFRLYLTSDPNDGNGQRTYYAEGTDGIHFTCQGVAFAQAGKPVMDPSTLRIDETWHYFAGGATDGGEGSNWYATSSDGKTFTKANICPTFEANGLHFLVSNLIRVPDGYRFYGFSCVDPNTASVIGSFFSTNGESWIADDGVRLTVDPSTGNETWSVKDPAVVRLSDGTYLMVYVTGIP